MKKIIIASVFVLCLLPVSFYFITSSPRYALREYILALKNKDYRKAYSMLSPDTQKKYSIENIVRINEVSMTLMNEDSTFVYWHGVMVGMQIYEDPGWWGYMLVKHKGKWRIVMRGGIPSFPFYWKGCKTE